jgi:hypothetical protein
MRNERTERAKAVHICFERIVPDELDGERLVRRELRRQMGEGSPRARTPAARQHVARMAVRVSKKWGPGDEVNCRFLDGAPLWRKWVEAIAHEWERHAHIRFRFVTGGEAQIRISFFADDGSWSAVGRDALNAAYFPLRQPTMNFGWIRDDTPAEERRRVVLHEFGHALGCIHEHEGPRFTRTWDREAVLHYFAGPPNYWSRDEIVSNVLHRYGARGILSTVYDPKSIMLYAFDAALFTDGKGPTNENRALSAKDKTMIRSMYPKARGKP